MRARRIANGSGQAIDASKAKFLKQLRFGPAQAVARVLVLVKASQPENDVPVDRGKLTVGVPAAKVLSPATEDRVERLNDVMEAVTQVVPGRDRLLDLLPNRLHCLGACPV